jgi:hypothetical protein
MDVQNLLQPLCEQYGVQIVFAAHNHYYARACKNGVYHITTAGGGAPLYEIEEEFPNVINTLRVHHYCKVAIEGDTMTVTAIKPDGEVIDEFQIDQSNRPNHLLGFLTKENGPGLIDDASISASGQTTTADETGYYGLELVPGYHEASFLLSGYVPLTETIEVFEGTETQLDTTLSLSQGCLPEGITFTTQEEIDNFQNDHPFCTEIEGDIIINGDDINNLNGLNLLTAIGGSLSIGIFDAFADPSNPILVNLSGLDNLTSIGGSLEISSNLALTSLTGLENIVFIGGHLHIRYNSALISISGLENVTSIGSYIRIANNSLISLAGLENLSSIGGSLNIEGNTALSNLIGLDNVTNVEGLLNIVDNSSMINLNGLNNLTSIGNSLDISGNDALITLSGLESLSFINGELEIGGGYPSDGNPSLTDISALANLTEASITNLKIRHNSSLSTCTVQSICDYLASPNGFYLINDNAPGCNSPEEVDSLCNITGVPEYDPKHDLSISPNPVKDLAVLSLNIGSKTSVEVCVYNTTGICLKNWQFQNQLPGEKEFKLDLKKLTAGIYFCRVQIGNIMVTKKIIKVK